MAKDLEKEEDRTGMVVYNVPEHLKKRYFDSVKRAGLFSLENEAALCETRIQEILDNLEEAGIQWGISKIQDICSDLITEVRAGNTQESLRLVDNQVELLNKYLVVESGWRELFTIVDQKRRLSETELKRSLVQNQNISLKQLMDFINSVAKIIRSQVRDENTIDRVLSAIRELLYLEDGDVQDAEIVGYITDISTEKDATGSPKV